MLLDVPFLPDEAYVAFLADNAQRLHGIHFSLHDGAGLDARPPGESLSADALADLLTKIRGPKKYALLNARFHDADVYSKAGALDEIIARLEVLAGHAELAGIVYADHYLLTALADRAPSLASSLEAVPSVNTGLDSVEKIAARVEYIHAAGFRAPSKIIPDRRLNRRPDEFAALKAGLGKLLPGAAVTLLVNEGCLADCPYKPAHDARLAYYNIGHGSEIKTPVNRMLGCLRLFVKEPWRLLTSPFVRPEDVHHLEGTADVVKVCGRSLGAAAVQRIVSAYLEERFTGNLLKLLDAPDVLAETFFISNEALPGDFFAHVCAEAEAAEEYCRALAASHIKKKARTLGGVRAE